jgi:hypothetical protein
VGDEHVHLGPRRQRGQLLQELGGLEQQMRRAIAPRLPQFDQHAPIGAASRPASEDIHEFPYRVGKLYVSKRRLAGFSVTPRFTSIAVLGSTYAACAIRSSKLARPEAVIREARDAGLDGVRDGDRAGLAHQDVAALALPDVRREPTIMAITDRGAAIRSSALSYERELGSRATGCPRCGSTCGFLNDCAVCLGEVLCARCLFGVRVDADEIHAAFVLEG